MANIFGNDGVAAVGGVAVDTIAQLVSQFAVDETGSSGRIVAITGGNTLDATPAVIAVAAASFTIPANTSRYISITAAGALVMEAAVSVGNLAIWQFTANATTITQAVDMRYNFSQIPTVAAFLTTGGADYIATAITAGSAASAAAAAASAVLTAADVVLTHADVVSTGLDAVATAADVVSAGISAAAAAASATSVNLRTINYQNAAYTVLVSDRNKLIEYGGAGGHTYSLPTIATLGGGFEFHVKHVGAGVLTIDANAIGGTTIDGVASIALSPEQSIVIVADGTNNLYEITQSRGYAVSVAASTVSFIPTKGLVATDVQAAIDELADGAVSPSQLTGYHYPTLDGNFRDLYRAGFKPSWFNQQWGGSQWGGLPDGSFGSVATGNVQDDTTFLVSQAAANYYASTGFIASETATFDEVFIKLYKVANPVYNLTVRVYSNTAGSPNAAIGSAATLSMKLVTSKADGEWYRVTGLAAALTAGTQYHLVISSLAAVDATNYVVWKATASNKYPLGGKNLGTSVPAWTPTTTAAGCFLLVNPVANSLIQSAGMFDYKLAFAPGTPANQSRSLSQPLVNFYDGKHCTVLHRGTYAVSTNVWDFAYGLDHDRITLTINASGYPVLSIYESDRTLAQVTGTGSVASGNHDVAIRVRTVGDGADLAYLYVDGVSVGTPLTAQTFTMAQEMRDLGTARLGDGFGIIPAWTQDMQMTSLPSAQGWTWTGTGTEANCMSVAGGKLYQNANGYTSTQTGHYTKTVVLNNTTGWTITTKIRVTNDRNTTGVLVVSLDIKDGAKNITLNFHEYWVFVGYGVTTQFHVQADFKTADRVVTVCGKGSDYYVFIDGNLLVDGTGLATSASATNAIRIGDIDSTASENADAIWSYFKYYQGGMLLPVANNASCSEFAHWSGDKTALLPYAWNAGTPVSIKQLCGVGRNYVGEGVGQTEVRRGVTSAPTVASATDTLQTDMESYILGESVESEGILAVANGSAGNTMTNNIYIDGAINTPDVSIASAPVAAYIVEIPSRVIRRLPLGLHKIEARTAASAGTNSMSTTRRTLSVKARS